VPDASVIVFGAGGHGRVVADVARSAGRRVLAFVDDASAADGASVDDVQVISWEHYRREAARWTGVLVALAIGDNRDRATCHARLLEAHAAVATLVHAAGTVARNAELGEGSVLMAGAVMNPGARVGRGCIVNTGAVVEHDCTVGAYAHLSPNVTLGGGVRVGDRAHLGLGAVVLPGVRVGDDVQVGAGAVVHRDVPTGLTVAGVPARPLRGKRRSPRG